MPGIILIGYPMERENFGGLEEYAAFYVNFCKGIGMHCRL
jgi:hypothetical protein